MRSKILVGLLGGVSMAIASPAMADPITLDSGDVGTSFTIDFDGFTDAATNTIDNLTSSITFTLQQVTGSSYIFDYLVDNTTSGGLTSNLSSFAFDVDPDISGASVDGAYSFAFVADGQGSDPSYPNQVGQVDVCFKAANSGSCSNGGGVSEGSSGSGSLTLNFDSAASEITLSDFFVRYQGISGAGDVTSATGQSTTSSSSSGTQVPEPGMLGLLGLSLLGAGFMHRRRRRDGGVAAPQPAFA